MRAVSAIIARCCLPLLLCVDAHLPLRPRDADFDSVRTGLDHPNVDTYANETDKYFHESTFGGHYDGRFAAKQINYAERQRHLTALVQSYMAFMHDIGAETWLMHGTLLGWWWNRRIMPWDSDIDVMTSEKSMDFLADFHNMTIHRYRFPADHHEEGGQNPQPQLPPPPQQQQPRSYLLEVNPHCRNSTAGASNKIDARWIDRATGMFIDITTARRNATAVALGDAEALMVKDGHRYRYDDIWPLRASTFERVPVSIPFAYAEILAEEYGDAALAMARFGAHHFSEAEQRWLMPFEEDAPPPTRAPPTVWQWLVRGG